MMEKILLVINISTYYIMLSRSYRRKIFEIDSQSRTSGPAYDFTSDINIPFRNQFNTMTLLYAEIDKTYYMLSSDPLDLTVNNIPVTTNSVPVTVELLPDVNYNGYQLALSLQTILNAQTSGGYGVVYNNNSPLYTSGTFTIINTVPFSIDFTNSSLIARYLGFEPVVNTAVLDSGVYYLIGTKQARLERYDCLVISTNLSINGNDSVLAYIFPSTTITGGVIVYQNNYNNFFGSVAAGDTQSNYLRTSLTDKSTGNIINLNGGQWRLTFSLSEEGI